MKRALLVALASAFLFACGGDDNKQEPGVDAGIIVVSDAGVKADAGVPGADAGTTPTCVIDADLGDLGALTEEDVYAEADVPAGPEYIYSEIYLDESEIYLEMLDGMGAFADGLKTGSFVIKGDDLNFGTCGLCVTMIGGSLESPVDYMATGGTVTLTSIKGQLKGSLSNVTFETVTIAGIDQGQRSTPIGDGCVSRIGSVSFDASLELMEEEL